MKKCLRRGPKTARSFIIWETYAIDFVNVKYLEINRDSDNCDFCNKLDDALNKENCWLISTTHDCSEVGQPPEDIVIKYSYGGDDYTVSLVNWLKGDTPHLKGE